MNDNSVQISSCTKIIYHMIESMKPFMIAARFWQLLQSVTWEFNKQRKNIGQEHTGFVNRVTDLSE